MHNNFINSTKPIMSLTIEILFFIIFIEYLLNFNYYNSCILLNLLLYKF